MQHVRSRSNEGLRQLRKCIGLDHTDKSPEYRAIKVDGIIDETMNPSDYLYDEETLEVPDEDDDIFGDDLFPFVRGNQR